MRIALSLIALTLATSAAADGLQPGSDALADPSATADLPDAGWTSPMLVPNEPANCRDRIHQARMERGLPKLERDTASPDEPLFIAAVDKRIGGCSVLVMRNDTSDIRPLPALPDGPPRLMPAR